MKKITIIAIAAFLFCIQINAQNSKVDFDISLGFLSTSCDNVYDNAKAGIYLGIDARKTLAHLNDAATVYGLLGLRYVKKGGKTTTDIAKLNDDGVNLVSNHIQIPLHGGLCYSFKKCSIYLNVGPYLGFKASEDSDNDKKTSSLSNTEIGYGVNLGIRFKHFGFGFGSEQGLTKFGTFDNGIEKKELKNSTGHFELKWTF